MPILRIRKDPETVSASVPFLKDPMISAYAKVVYAIAADAQVSGEVEPGPHELASYIGVSVETINSAIHELETISANKWVALGL